MSECFFNARDHGAEAIAQPSETLTVENPQFGGLVKLTAGETVAIYHPTKGCDYDSVGIQKAIDAAHAAGGGTVYVPAGDYLIAPIRLRSRVNLHLAPGAHLWGSPYLEDYFSDGDVIVSSVDKGFGRKDRGLSGANKMRLVHAEDAEDVAITGMGLISGQSPRWIIPWLNSKPDDWFKERPTDTLIFHRCRRVRIEGIRILDTPAWTLVFDNCEHVAVRGIDIRSTDVINSDGIDLVNTSFATISDCKLHCTDDAICLKNTQPDTTMGQIAVTNCVIRTLCNGLKIGTDTAGNFENITFSNIVIRNHEDDAHGAEGGVNLCALDGGFVRNVSVDNVVMDNVQCPFYLVARCRKKNQKHRTPRPGRMSGIMLSNIQAEGAKTPAFVVGHEDEPIRDVSISNLRVRKARQAYRQAIPEFDGTHPRYPTPYMFGERPDDRLPAAGLYLRHTSHVKLENIELDIPAADARPGLKVDQSENVSR
jgi:polygalacturonase